MSCSFHALCSSVATYLQVNTRWEKEQKDINSIGNLVPKLLPRTVENTLTGAFSGAVLGVLASATKETAAGWSINLNWLRTDVTTFATTWKTAAVVGSCAAIASVISPVSYHLVNKINDGSEALSKQLGYRKAIKLPAKEFSYVLQLVLGALIANQAGVGDMAKNVGIDVNSFTFSAYAILLPHFTTYLIEKYISKDIRKGYL
jgi:hypothetical protein